MTSVEASSAAVDSTRMFVVAVPMDQRQVLLMVVVVVVVCQSG